MNVSKPKVIILTCLKILIPAIFLAGAIAELTIRQYLDFGTLLFGSGCIAYYNYKAGNTSVRSLVFYNCWCLLITAYFGYQNYSKYKKQVYSSKFGLPLNTMRHNAGAPIIPKDWSQSPFTNRDIEWRAKNDSFGHIWKTIFLDSLSHYVEWEEDVYKLVKSDKDTSYLSIRICYKPMKKSDTTTYTLEIGFNNKDVSRRQADSIFKAKGIEKDY